MKTRITYSSTGDRRFEVDGKEVSEAKYNALIAGQYDARLKEMFDEQAAPRGVSDCTFMAGTANGRQFSGQDYIGDYYGQVAKAHGVSTTGKKYLSGLARFPGDPEAWVDSRGDVQRTLEKRGWGSEGTINVKKRELANDPDPGPDMAPDLVTKYAHEVASQYPNPHMIDMEDLKGQVYDHYKPKTKKKKVSKATKE